MAAVSNLFTHKFGIENTTKEDTVTLSMSQEGILYLDVIKQKFWGENTLIKRITIKLDEIKSIEYVFLRKDKSTKKNIYELYLGYVSAQNNHMYHSIRLEDYPGKENANKNFVDSLKTKFVEFNKEKENIKKISHQRETECQKPITVEAKPISLNTITSCKKFKDYVVLDLETTGLSRKYDKIVEIAMIKFADNEVTHSTESFVNPEMHISEEASRVNNIHDSDVKNAPKIEEIIDSINEFIGDLPIVAHNASFDIAFLAREMSNAGITRVLEYVDTLSLCRKILNLNSNSLESVSEYLHLERKQKHRALDDSVATAEILQYCLNKQITEYEEKRTRKKEEKDRIEEWRKENYSASSLFDVGISFTGEFSASREDMEKAAKKVGALVKEKISRKVSYLVLGDISNYTNGSKKFEDAHAYREEGYNIKIISEIEFFRIVENAKNEILKDLNKK